MRKGHFTDCFGAGIVQTDDLPVHHPPETTPFEPHKARPNRADLPHGGGARPDQFSDPFLDSGHVRLPTEALLPFQKRQDPVHERMTRMNLSPKDAEFEMRVDVDEAGEELTGAQVDGELEA